MPGPVGQAWRRLSNEFQTDLLHCECACGVQNATHLWFECSRTDAMRTEVCAAATTVVDAKASPVHRQWWHGLDHEAQLRHVVSSHDIVHMGVG